MNRLFLVMFVFSAALLPAQTAAELERILAVPTVACDDAAWLILSAAGTVPPGTSAADAFRYAADNNWLPKKVSAKMPITLGSLSFLVMKAMELKGGILYALFPGPRYSYRELTSRKILQGRVYSTLPVSGEQLVRILSRALAYFGDTVLPPTQEERQGMGERIPLDSDRG
jgi:hypothetical protein